MSTLDGNGGGVAATNLPLSADRPDVVTAAVTGPTDAPRLAHPSLGKSPHDKAMAAQFLASLDPSAERFTFQFFGDGPDRHAEVFHGTLDEVWPKVRALNTPERRVGAFVTIAQTDFKGRREQNILRPRALFIDADTPEQITICTRGIEACDVTPSMVVKSGRGLHVYWCCPDIPRDQFSALQRGLIEKLGTDKAIHDLARVMRLPGTLHLKDAAEPHLVTLCPMAAPSAVWGCSELVAKFGKLPALPVHGGDTPLLGSVIAFKPPDWAVQGRVSSAFAQLPAESLSVGLEPNIDEIRSAVLAIPPSAIATEADWMKLARGLAHESAIHPSYSEQLWGILDAASHTAPRYNQQDNRERFLRYIREAFNRSNPITIATLFCMALDYGWDGGASSTGSRAGASSNSSGSTSAGSNSRANTGSASQRRAVHISSLPQVPPKREWLHGTDLIRGAATVLAAPGGRAKSTYLLTCALACASGRPLLGSHVFGGHLRVLVVSTEDGLSELTLRLRAAMKHYKLLDTDLPDLYLIGADRWGLPLLRMEGNRAVLDSAGMSALTTELDHIQPDVLIIDPLINVLGGVSANDNAAAALLMHQLTSLATTRRMAVALAHHTSKGRDPTSAESAMGAASFTNLARIALSIEPLDEKNAGTVGLPPWEAKSVFRLLGTKQNFGPPKSDDRYFRLVSVPMPNAQPPIYMTGDNVAVVEPFQPNLSGPAFAHDLVRAALQTIDAANPSLTPSKRSSERYAAPVIADAIKPYRAGQASEADGKAVLDHLINTGLAAVADVKVSRGGKGSDIRKGLVVTAAGKVALQQVTLAAPSDPTPQSPQHAATTLQEDAGGTRTASPQRKGGMGGNAGVDTNAVHVDHTSTPEGGGTDTPPSDSVAR